MLLLFFAPQLFTTLHRVSHDQHKNYPHRDPVSVKTPCKVKLLEDMLLGLLPSENPGRPGDPRSPSSPRSPGSPETPGKPGSPLAPERHPRFHKMC